MKAAPGGPSAAEVPPDLLRHLYPKVRRWALSFTGDRDVADDVTQEALFRIWRRVGSYEGTSLITSWAYAITRNAAREHHRREARAQRARDGIEPRTTPDPRAALGARMRLRRTLQRLQRLPEEQRAALALTSAGFTSVEAAERMGVRPGTVRARVCRARARLTSEEGVA